MIDYQGLPTLEILEEAKNYNNWIIENFTQFLVSPILEIGAGTGNISKYFDNKKDLYLTDNDKGLVSYLQKKYKNSSNITVRELDILDNQPERFTRYFKTIIGINVLEHIKDDEKALKNIYNLLVKDGRLLLLVPAKKFAYKKLDKELGHYRRYEKKELIKKSLDAGFQIENIYYFNAVGLIAWLVRDLIEKSGQFKPYQVRIFDKIVPFLRYIEKLHHPPLGVSLILVATKKE